MGELPSHNHTATSNTTNITGTFALKGTEGTLNTSGNFSQNGSVGTSYNGHLSSSTSAPKIQLNANIIPNLIISNTGSNQSHNNLQPYHVCYIWKRTA